MKAFQLLISTILISSAFTSCSNEDGPDQVIPESGKRQYHVVLSVDPTQSNSVTFSQSVTDLKTGNITFNGYGFEVPSVRTARVYASSDGNWLYNLNYGGGTIAKFDPQGGQNYNMVAETNVKYAIGTEYPRWTKVSDENALLHNIVSTHRYNESEEYQYTDGVARLVNIALDDMAMGSISEMIIPKSAEDQKLNHNVWRIDAPVIANGKAYYGVAKRHYDPNTNVTDSKVEYAASTLIVDFPSLENPKMISSEIGKGSTYGYRTPVAHLDEKGDIYQLSSVGAKILRIKSEGYDNSYVLDLSQLIGHEVASNGWFYVGDGIGYVPFYDTKQGSSVEASAWGVARIDLYNNSAVELDLPDGLWLQQYQHGIIDEEGYFCMAITPYGKGGNIYRFDPKSTQPDGFILGATLASGAEACYLGIF